MFKNHIYITTSDELENFDLIYSYREYYKNYGSSLRRPSKLSSGYILRDKSISKEYFDNLFNLRFNDIYISSNFIFPQIELLNRYVDCHLDININLIISNERYNNTNYDDDENEVIVLIFPPKKFIKEYQGGDLIFKLDHNELKIDTTNFSYDFYTIILFDKIDCEFETIKKGYACVFITTIKYKDNTIEEIKKK